MFKTYFQTLFSHVSEFSNRGSRVIPSYKVIANDKGVVDLYEKGKVNLYEYIQSFKDSTDIHVLIERFMKGDESVLTSKKAMYGDFTLMPDNIHELSERLVNAEYVFNSLPLSEREKFNHSASQFFSAIGSDSFNEWLHSYTNDEPVNLKTAVVDNSVPAEGSAGSEGEVISNE